MKVIELPGSQPKGRLSPQSSYAMLADPEFDRWAIQNGANIADRWLDTALVGTMETNEDGTQRRVLILDCRPKDPLVLISTPFDSEDKTAVLVLNMEGKWLGYLHRSLARKVAKSMNAGAQWLAVVRHILFYEEEGSDIFMAGLNVVIFKLSKEFVEKSNLREGKPPQHHTRNLSAPPDEEEWD